MKIIFLDFDGVILTGRTMLARLPAKGFSAARPDPVLCDLLKHCCENGVKIVVSSTWREIGDKAKSKLFDADLEQFLHPDWRTISTECRPAEIHEWLTRHPEVTDYRIIDDDDHHWDCSGLPSIPDQRPHWLPCCSENGMQFHEMHALAEWAGLMDPRPQSALPAS